MKKIFIIIGILLIIASISFIYKQRQRAKFLEQHTPKYTEGKIVVGFKKGVDIETIKRITSKYNLKISDEKQDPNVPMLSYLETNNIYYIEVPIGKEKRFLKKLQKEPEIVWTFPFYDITKVIID